jgi:hypothetical protein
MPLFIPIFILHLQQTGVSLAELDNRCLPQTHAWYYTNVLTVDRLV